MKFYLVSSHHRLDRDPASQQGVLFNSDMLDRGIWFSTGGSSVETDTKFEKTCTFERAQNEAEYRAVFEALDDMSRDKTWHDDMAVVSLMWSPYFGRLILPKRVWLHLYFRMSTTDLEYKATHDKDGRPYRTFLEGLREPTVDKIKWRGHFALIAGAVTDV
ncbi:MAG: hypothetical protein Q7R54_00470 [bacterium]|nr:hypothetical protein [bacterium]